MICPSPYTVRLMQLADIPTIVDIDKQSFPSPTKPELFAYELTENKLAQYHCLLEGQTIIGYDGFWVVGDEMHISTIAIHPAWRGLGLGELLLQHTLFEAQQSPITMVTLEVRQSNLVAQTLYKKYQFQEVGLRKKYYRDTGEDAILMTLSPLNAPFANFLEDANQHLCQHLLK